MSYDSVRMSEQMDALDPSIYEFIDRYNTITAALVFLGLNPARQTLFLFPGGMASRLKRATKAWDPAGPASQTFKYKELWLNLPTFLGGEARQLRMHKTPPPGGEYRDKGDRIIIADRVVSLLGVSPYVGFTTWCSLKGIDWFIFPWDWRRNVDDVATFFVDRFLPHFQGLVQSKCNNADPLADFSLIGHSAGGLVVNWILRNADPLPATLRKVITVAAPFYGYGHQLHRWFEGDDLVNGGGAFTDAMRRMISSLPGCYSWHFLPEDFYNAHQTDFKSDLAYPLPNYPSTDSATGNPVDTYNPQPPGRRYPTKPQTGFDFDELHKAKNLFDALTSPLSTAQAAKFVNIRGDTTANNTLNTTSWKQVPPIFPSPIADTSVTPGDGTQPAWGTRDIGLFKQVPGNVLTVSGSDAAHMIIMNSPQTIAHVAAVLGIP
jgi:hypothetical protein